MTNLIAFCEEQFREDPTNPAEDLVYDIIKDPGFPRNSSQRTQIEYLKTKAIKNPHIKEALGILLKEAGIDYSFNDEEE